MSKSFSFPNVGTCSKQTNIVLNDDHTIESVEVIGGCNGNLKGISRLLKGMKAEDAIARMEGTTCGPRPTSCPDQIAKNLKRLWQRCNRSRSEHRTVRLHGAVFLLGSAIYPLCGLLALSVSHTVLLDSSPSFFLAKGEPTHRLNSAATKGQAIQLAPPRGSWQSR